MTERDARKRLAALPDMATAALAPALHRVAEMVAAETSRRRGAGSSPAVATGRDDQGRATVTVAAAADLEFGTLRTPARPVLRPAMAATADMTRQVLREALHDALKRGAR